MRWPSTTGHAWAILVTTPSYVSEVNSNAAGSRPAETRSERSASVAAASLGRSPVGASHVSAPSAHCHGLIVGFEYEKLRVPSSDTQSDGDVPSCGPTVHEPSFSSGVPSTPSAAPSAPTTSAFDAPRASNEYPAAVPSVVESPDAVKWFRPKPQGYIRSAAPCPDIFVLPGSGRAASACMVPCSVVPPSAPVCSEIGGAAPSATFVAPPVVVPSP